jgi:hypothetical protein
MRFLPYSHAAALPNIIIDGAATENTVITLSHWPKSGTPTGLKGDTSAEIVFNYLDAPQCHVSADSVSNNHFDEDGLVGIFAMVEPATADRHRGLLLDVARAGDFGVFKARDAARIAFALSAFADPDTTPLARDIFNRPYPDVAGELYIQLLPILPRLLTGLADYQPLWEREDAELTRTEQLIDKGDITIEEFTDLDLAIVQAQQRAAPHRFALHSRTPCSRLLVIEGRQVDFEYRYESWVQMASRRPALRVDLSELATELNRQEQSVGRWVFDGVNQITPRLHFDGVSSLSSELIAAELKRYLRTGVPAWDPYD